MTEREIIELYGGGSMPFSGGTATFPIGFDEKLPPNMEQKLFQFGWKPWCESYGKHCYIKWTGSGMSDETLEKIGRIRDETDYSWLKEKLKNEKMD